MTKIINFLLVLLFTSNKDQADKIPIFKKNKIVGFLITPESLTELENQNKLLSSKLEKIDQQNNFFMEKARRQIEDDITVWFNKNYDYLKPTLDYLKDK